MWKIYVIFKLKGGGKINNKIYFAHFSINNKIFAELPFLVKEIY